ncbi:MAG: hypothetical protein ACKOU7_05620 [Ferruginibacter sp.]
MKKIISIGMLLLCCIAGKAQNNLQFNRVVTIFTDSVSNCSSNCADTVLLRTIVVPANKVLKIESINFTPGNYFLFLNGVAFSRVATTIANNFPIWLPSGTYYIYFGTYNTANSQAGNYSYLLSAIEFNVVP